MIGRFLSLNTDMQWIYNNEPVIELPNECVGFVYLITNTENGRMYVGKKLSRFKTTRYKMHTQKNGKKIRKKIRGAVASDWLDYYGSSDQLTRDIETLGRDRFRREILYYCKTSRETCQCDATKLRIFFANSSLATLICLRFNVT